MKGRKIGLNNKNLIFFFFPLFPCTYFLSAKPVFIRELYQV